MKKSELLQIVIIIASSLIVGVTLMTKMVERSTVRAFGDLDVDFGVPEGEPIFVFNDFKPGDCTSKQITVVNNGPDDAKVAVRSKNEENVDGLASQLTIVISENSTDIYGGSNGEKRLDDFFADSDNENGVPLSTVTGNGGSAVYTFTVCFEWEAGNKYQETKVVFDLTFGEISVPIELPDECKELEGIITEVIWGTEGNDKIKGTIASELIWALGGNDKIDPSSGHDCVIAGDGNDKVIDSTGNDIIWGGGGNDKLEGGDGFDKIHGGEGNDTLDGGSDDDEIWGDAGNDAIKGGSGNDLIYGGAGQDNIKAGSGNDMVYGEEDKDKIDGGSGDDYLDGDGSDHDVLKGGSGNDTCINGEVLTSCELP